MIVVNKIGQHTGVGDVFCATQFDPRSEYVMLVSLLKDQPPNVQVPVVSVGRHEGNGLYYFAADERFVMHHGFECVWPRERHVEIEVTRRTDRRWVARALTPRGQELRRTAAEITLEEAERAIIAWAEREGLVITDPDPDLPPAAEAALEFPLRAFDEAA